MAQSRERLEAAGFDLHGATGEQAEVLSSLTDDELRVLQDVKGRIEAAGPDVEGHTSTAPGTGSEGGWCW